MAAFSLAEVKNFRSVRLDQIKGLTVAEDRQPTGADIADLVALAFSSREIDEYYLEIAMNHVITLKGDYEDFLLLVDEIGQKFGYSLFPEIAYKMGFILIEYEPFFRTYEQILLKRPVPKIGK